MKTIESNEHFVISANTARANIFKAMGSPPITEEEKEQMTRICKGIDRASKDCKLCITVEEKISTKNLVRLSGLGFRIYTDSEKDDVYHLSFL